VAQTLDSIAFLQYTGGTTGLSKGAVLTHGNIVAAILQAEAWFTPALARVGDVSKCNCIAALPLYHIFALTLCLLSIRWGAHITLVPNPRDIGKFVDVLKRRPFHLLPAVNTLFNALLQHPQFRSIDFSQLCVSQAGGMAASEGTARQWQQVTGCTMVEGWGMSETCAIGTNNPVMTREFSGSIGLPLPSIEIAIKDDDGHSVAIKVNRVRSASRAERDARLLPAGRRDAQGIHRRWFHAHRRHRRDGRSRLHEDHRPQEGHSRCARRRRVRRHRRADEKQGEAIKVFVVKNDPILTEDDVAKFCRQNLTGYKVPKYIEFRDDLPKTNVGKILRRELRTSK
jgi:long-chain acyl-CoA synthetase